MRKFSNIKWRGNFWLLVGLLSYIGTSVSSIIRSIAPTTLSNNLYMAVDWLAACIPYFFFGALLGFIIDWILKKIKKEKSRFPLWFYLTLVLWIGSIIIIGLFSRKGLLEPALIIFFPLAFGIFFVGSAFVLLTPDFIEKSFYGKLVFDLIYLLMFGAWIYLSINKHRSWKVIRTILIVLIFFVLFLGFSGCVKTLS